MSRRPLSTAALLLVLGLAAAAGPLAAQSGDPVADAQALMLSGRFADARKMLESLVRAVPTDGRPVQMLGRAYLAEGEVSRAIGLLERAVRLDPRAADARFYLADAYGTRAMGSGRVERASLLRRARGELEQAIALDPDHLEARWALLRFHLMTPPEAGGSRVEARRQVEEIRRLNPYRGALAAGAVHTAGHDDAAAAASYEAVLQWFPDSVPLYLLLASAYDRQERHEAAFDLFEALLRRRPGEMGALYQIGRLGAVSGERLERAEAALRGYLRHEPGAGEPPLAAAHWRLGMVLERRGRPNEARAAYRAALRLDPTHREAREALRRLEG